MQPIFLRLSIERMRRAPGGDQIYRVGDLSSGEHRGLQHSMTLRTRVTRAVVDSAESLMSAGSGALENGDWAGARDAFGAVVEQAVSPTCAEALVGLAEALWWLGDIDGATTTGANAGFGEVTAHDAPGDAFDSIHVATKPPGSSQANR